MPVFLGPGFHLEAVAQINFSTIRVTFAQDPKLVDPTTTNDGLNPSNYFITGPSRNYIVSVAPVAGDPQSVDLTTKAPLLLGAWTITVANVVEDNLTVLSAPTALEFLVTSQPVQTPLAGGTTNDEVTSVIRKFFNPALKGSNWDAIIAGISAGDETNWDNARKAFDQFFLSTASGIYLDRRAGDQGQKRPTDIGMPDTLFRQLATAVKNHKLTEEAILEVLEVFYGTDAVRAFAQTEMVEPYAFNDGDVLSVLLDEKQQVDITFTASHFANSQQALAIEVAAEITRALKDAGSDAYAIEYDDPIDGTAKVRLYSGSLGLTSAVRFLGGKMQTVLRFPTSLFEPPLGSTSWTWATSPTDPDYLRFTGGAFFNLDLVEIGDLALFYGTPFTTGGILGTYPITAVGAYYVVSNPLAPRQQYFEIFAPNIAGNTGNQTSFTALMFFRPKKRTIYDETRHAIVSETDGIVNIIIPATTQAVARQPGTGAYLNVRDAIPVSALTRTDGKNVAITTTTPHDLQVGDQVQLDNVFGSGTQAPFYPNNPSGAYSANIATGVTEASLATTSSESHTFQGYEHHVHRLREGELFIVGGETKAGAVHTAIAHPTLLEITSETVEPSTGGRWQNYKWTSLATRTYTSGQRQFGSSTGTITDNGAISNDRVLVTGGTAGDDVTGTSLNTWDLFTYSKVPAQNLQIGGTMPVARAGHAQASLIFYELICGGWTTAGTAIGTTYAFDFASTTWTAKGAMLRARMKHQLTEFQVGSAVRALATGGRVTGGGVLNHCEVYEVNTNAWRVTGPMTYARYDHAQLKLPDGRIIVFGGTGYNPTQNTIPVTLASVEIYDPITELWNRLDPMKVARTRPAVAYIPSRNAIYVAGTGTMIEIFDLTTMTWTKPIVGVGQGFYNSQGGCVGVDTFAVIGGTAPGPISGTIAIRINLQQPL